MMTPYLTCDLVGLVLMKMVSCRIRFDLKTVDYLPGIKYLYFTFTFLLKVPMSVASAKACKMQPMEATLPKGALLP